MDLKPIVEKATSARFIVVVMLTITFCWITIKGFVKPESFITIYSVAIGFYFAKNRIEDMK